MATTPYNLITITGPTASGKTSVAAHLARQINGEIISADSRQVYRGMDIGTGKDLSDYMVDGLIVPYHLIDIADAGYEYNVFEYQRDFINAFNDIRQRGKFPIVCGGSGMYIEAVLKGYKLINVPINEELRKSLAGKTLDELAEILKKYKTVHNNSDIETPKRATRAIEIEEYYRQTPQQDRYYPEIKALIVGMLFDRETRRQRITERLKARFDEGMIDEIENLINNGVSPEALIYYGLEYKYITRYVSGEISYNEMFSQLETAIHQFSKRQMTWFRHMEKNGTTIHWIDGSLPLDEKLKQIERLVFPD
ncbi:MAG TPA: tRNA (adenosine(37)-N6)-dimethylallyltransferase MiaA [Prolixibacteraceae bacterium]|nr:tRNA (adenosine(37)-N6)-dimethylallyltransferase MiaA [Prolixibacteraceae bacterium]